jgi:CelD/BcsL family acetyltransferase involved in cellulose biosynthesis
MQRLTLSGQSSTCFAFKVFRNLRDVESLWRAVQACSPAYVFQSFEWASLWYETIGKALSAEPFIVVVSVSDDIVALFPLAIRRRGGCRILEFLGSIVTDYNAPLFLPNGVASCHPVDALWDRIVALARPDVVLLEQMPEYLAGNALNPMVTQRRARHATNAHAARLPSSFDEFSVTLDRFYFRNTRRRHRKLAQVGTIRFNIPNNREEIAQTIDVLFAQKQRKYGSRYVDPRVMPAFEGFYRKLALAPLCYSRPVTANLRVGEEIVASNLGVVHDGRFYGLMSGHESGAWAQMAPGRQLMHKLVEWCISAGIKTFDLTVGDEDYKRYLCNHVEKLYESCYPVTMTGLIFLLFKRVKYVWRRRRSSPRQTARRVSPVGEAAADNASKVN